MVALAAAGIAAGLVGSLAATRVIRSLLFGVGPNDSATFATIAAVVAVTAILAGYLSARRATRVDPMISLRSE